MLASVFLMVALLGFASAGTLRFHQPNEINDHSWKNFKMLFDKKYSTPFHEMLKRQQWEKNMRYIQKHNAEADLGKHTYRLGMNQFTDLSNFEYRKLMLCTGMSKRRSMHSSEPDLSDVTTLPKSVDWRKKGYVTPVKNQGQCGSCWAFSTTGSVEGQHFKKTHHLVSLSEQNLVDCSTSYGNNGCGGGLMDNAFKYIIGNKGIDTEKSYPYEAADGPCRFRASTVGAKIKSYKDVKHGSEYALKVAAAKIGPISVAIDASNPSFQAYQGGIYYEPDCSSVSLDHGVLVVGYGTDDGQDYWLVKNSWGESWGLDGYIKMARNMDNNCGIASMASYPIA